MDFSGYNLQEPLLIHKNIYAPIFYIVLLCRSYTKKLTKREDIVQKMENCRPQLPST